MLIGHSLADGFGTLLAVDRQVCEIMQREERELVGAGFQTLTHPDDCTRNAIALSNLQIGGEPSNIRKRYLRPDGSSVWADVQVSRLRDGANSRLVGTIRVFDAKSLTRGPEELMRAAAHELELVQCRRREVGNDLFLDYGWLVLLQIYLAEAEGQIASVTSISDAATMRPVLVVRWLEVLEQKGMVTRRAQPDQPPQLTARGFHKIEYLMDRSFDR